jgi:hypothetical protein
MTSRLGASRNQRLVDEWNLVLGNDSRAQSDDSQRSEEGDARTAWGLP